MGFSICWGVNRRSSDVYGRRLSPARIELVYGDSRLIEQIVVLGNGRAYLVALIMPNEAAIETELLARWNNASITGEADHVPLVKELIRLE